MRRLLPVLALAACVTPALAQPVTNTKLDVYVKNSSGVPVASAQVVAMRFGNNGPDVGQTRIAWADTTGLARFRTADGNGLVDGNDYEIFVSSQGFLPSIRDQFNNPEHTHVWANGAYLSTPTITLSSYSAADIGQVNVAFTNASAALVSGSVRGADADYTEPVAFAMAASAGGNGVLRFDNVPIAPAGAYSADAFDAVKNRNVSKLVDVALTTNPVNLVVTYDPGVDFSNGMPPITVKSDPTQPSVAGGLSVDGVVADTDSVNSVPWVGINLHGDYVQSMSTMTDYRWANSDQNGRFQFYGLRPGVTYYADVFGGCDWQIGTCYKASPSAAGAAGFGAAPGPNDFLYTGTTVNKVMKLETAPAGTGVIKVHVEDNLGHPIPQAGVGIGPDGMGWETSGSCAGHQMRTDPGLANVNANTDYAGNVTINNLPAGNYQINVWTPFGQQGNMRFNDGPDKTGCWQTGSCWCGTDDYRVTLATGAGAGATPITVWDSSGTQVGAARSVLTVTVPLNAGNTGKVRGTLTLPRSHVDLSGDPIIITLQPNCSGGGMCPAVGNMGYFVDADTGPTINYEIPISSGYQYWMNVNSSYWGVVRDGGGNNSVDLSTGTDTAVVNLRFAPAGRLLGKLYKPDGSVYRPLNSMNGHHGQISANGDNSYGWAQVNDDGTYAIGGLLAGEFTLRVSGWGNFTYTTPVPAPKVTIQANQDATMDVHAVDGMPVRIDVATTSLTPISFVPCTQEAKDCPVENYGAKLLPAGTVFDEQAIRGILFHDEGAIRFDYRPVVGNGNGCEGGGDLSQPGFCVSRVPSPQAYDAYLYRQGGFDSSNLVGVRPHFTLLTSTRNVIVDDSPSRTTTMFWSGSTVTVRPVDMSPAQSLRNQGMVAFKGTVTGQNLYRQQDFDAMGGNFENFMKYIPLMTVYDSSGALTSAGMVIPSPACFGQTMSSCDGLPGMTRDACLNHAVAKGDFSLFNQIFAACGGMGYELRGIKPGVYTAVLTSPNYPPYQTSVSLLASGSTVTLNIDLDSAVGAGATLTGVVSSTNSVAIANAGVTIESEVYKERTFTTDANGRYTAQGLPAGSYRVKAKAAGYAPAMSRVDLGSSGSTSQDFTMRLAGAAITGTVYGQKVPFLQVQPGAQIVAYNDSLNVQDPAAELALFKTVTSSIGVYSLDGLEVGQVYKIFVRAPGKYVLSQSTLTVNGVRSGVDFALLSKPLDVELFGRPVPPNYEFSIKNPNDFKTGSAWVGRVPFSKTDAGVLTPTVTDPMFQQLPNNEMLLRVPIASLPDAAGDNTLHIEAISKAGKTVTKELVFGVNRKANATQSIDDALLGDDSEDAAGRKSNQALLDASGSNPSAITLPVGALIPVSSGAVPTCQFANTDVSASTVASVVGAVEGGTKVFASGVYQITMSSVNYNPDKGFDITLAYDKTNTSLADLALKHYNEATGKWEDVPGTQTIDPVKGTITVRRVRALASVLGLKRGHPMLAVATAMGYQPSAYTAQAAGSDTGFFSIMKPSLVGLPYTGSTLKVYNFPNPFNLSLKTPTLVHKTGGQTNMDTYGTIIKIEVPSTISGHGVIRIYTLDGELVREIDVDLEAGKYFYTEWDGRNFKGSKVANGVYYGVLSIPGVKAKDATFKMAVIK